MPDTRARTDIASQAAFSPFFFFLLFFFCFFKKLTRPSVRQTSALSVTCHVAERVKSSRTMPCSTLLDATLSHW